MPRADCSPAPTAKTELGPPDPAGPPRDFARVTGRCARCGGTEPLPRSPGPDSRSLVRSLDRAREQSQSPGGMAQPAIMAAVQPSGSRLQVGNLHLKARRWVTLHTVRPGSEMAI